MEPIPDEIKRLRGCINDLISVLGMSAIWSGRESEQIVSTLLDALLGMMRLDFAYARLKDPISGAPIEMVRFAQSRNLTGQPQEIGQLLDSWLGHDSRKWPLQVRNSLGDKDVSIVPLRLGLRDEIGVIVAGSQRADFPGETERLLLSVAANQAAIGLQEARLLSEQKRVARELDRRVALRTRELAVVVDGIPGLVAIMTADGAVEFVNQRVLEYFGRTLEQLKGWNLGDAVHADDSPDAFATWRCSIESGQPYDVDHRLRRADGVYRWFHAGGLPLRDAEGRIFRWYVLLTDIHERKTAEEKLRQDERELRRITDAIPDVIQVLRPDGTVLHVNQTALDYTGLTLEDVQREDHLARFFHPEDVERLREDCRQALTRAVPFENEQRALGRDGKYRWFLVRYNPLLDEQGRVIRWYATSTDIEDRKQAEERTRNENLALREEIDRSSMFEEIVGSSQALRKVLVQVAKVAPTDSTVLISGETGTGKELIARAIHKRSNRSTRAFISVNCGAIPQSLIASELFGHEKGAFTGAMQRRTGRFEAADGGTIFLDEIGELPMETQIALLRVLQEREFERIGRTEPLKVDVRVLAATNRDLRRAVSAGTFRQDLFYRLNVFPIEMPPLRERAGDIPLLAEYLIDRYGKQAGKKFKDMTKGTLELFQAYNWPGNIRELQNVIERAVVLCDSGTLSVDETWLKREATSAPGPAGPLAATMADRERELIEDALTQSRGRISGSAGAAARLGIPRQTLESKILSLGIDKHRFRTR
jgi:formate hydrogenlyase transcriptional activator